jgi:hypothetical protein
MLPAVRSYYNLEELWQAPPKRATKKAGAAAVDGATAAPKVATARRSAAPKAATAPRRRAAPGKAS